MERRAGNDFVRAEAQDASGTNNATLLLPADGGRAVCRCFYFGSTGSV